MHTDFVWLEGRSGENVPLRPSAPEEYTAVGEGVAPWDTWRALPAVQQPVYPDAEHLHEVITQLRHNPPLVFAGEVDDLRQDLAAAAQGKAFVLTGGDCAESFQDVTAHKVRSKIQTLLQMAVILTYGASLPVVKIGRIAGQYAKPRSTNTQTQDGLTLPSYRGDGVNSYTFHPQGRVPDPDRMRQMYYHSASTLNLIRAFTKGGYADLRLVHLWNQGFVADNPAYARYESLADEINRAIRFMMAAGVDFNAVRDVDLYSSHEALLLEYESALTRIDSRTGLAYNTSGHFLWAGERTRHIDGAHIELLARVHNPIGVKLGPSATPDDVQALVDKLNPEGIAGRLTFITRMGADKIRDLLPPLIDAVQTDGRPVLWVSDPMHGNTYVSESGYKTRRFETIMDEVAGFFDVHRSVGSVPGGIHIELTGDDVTEVLGGAENLEDERLAQRYETLVDPRLNHQQSLEMAFQVAELLR